MKRNRKNRAERKKRSWLKGILVSLAVLLLLAVLLAVSVFAYAYHHIDYTMDEALFSLAQGSHTTRLYYNGASDPGQPFQDHSLAPSTTAGITSLLPEGYLPVEWEAQRVHGGTDSIWCAYERIPQHMKDAFVAIEDKRFFQHEGVDWLRTIKAAGNYLLHFDGRFGGSTITQQLIKNISSDDDITVSRKLREICRAIHLESAHSKEEILELYLNIVPLSHGCVGVGAAAELYYGKPIEELTLAECASIAAITNSPLRFDPFTAAENNRARRDLILREMHAGGLIDAAAYAAALAEEPALVPLAEKKEPVYDWYTETVLSDVMRDLMEEKGLSQEMAEKMIYSGGLQIYTQMDVGVQRTLASYFEDASHFPADCRAGLCYAMTVCDPYTGDLLGIVSSVGKKTENRLLNYASRVTRAPGSALKPLSVYAPALEEGVVNWATVLDDVPLRFQKNATGYTAWPHNSPAVYSGLTDLQDAVAFSKNTVAVRVFERLGAEKSFSYLTRRLGLDTLVRGRAAEGGRQLTDLAAAPLALGQLSDGVSVRALTNAYGALAAGGVYRPSRTYSLVLDGKGRVLLERKIEADRVFSPETASIMTELLEGVTAYGTAKDLRLPTMVDTAGKTGTSGENHDKWFVGYTPYYTAGIWCGYADGNTEIPDRLSKTHLAVWDAVMRRLHRSHFSSPAPMRSFTLAPGVVRRTYCKDSGLLPCEACRKDVRGHRISTGYFKAGEEPRGICNRHVTVLYDKAGGGIARPGCPHEALEEIGMLRLPARDFPLELYVSDAQYGYRTLGDIPPSDATDQPFFSPLLSPGHYVGLSRSASGRQFNILCPTHGDEPEPEYEDESGDGNDPFEWLRRHFFAQKNKRA